MTRPPEPPADTAPTWVLIGWGVLVLVFAAALLWSCYRAWKDRKDRN